MRYGAAISALMLTVLVAPLPAQAQQQGGVRIDRERAETLSRDARKRAHRAAELERLAMQTEEAARRDEARIAEIREEIAGLEVTVAESRARLVALANEEAAARESLRRQRNQHAAAFSAMVALSKVHAPELIAYNGDPVDAARGASLLGGLRSALQEQARGLRERLQQLADLRLETEAAREETREAIQALRSRERELWALVGKRKELSRGQMAEAEAMRRDAEQMSSQARALASLLRRAPAPPPRPPRVTQGSTPRILSERLPLQRARGKFAWPVVGGQIVDTFSEGRGENADLGIVFDAEPFAIVYSPWAGVVSYAGPVKSLGLVTVIDLGEGFQIVLAGLSTLSRQKGDSVLKGEPLGRLNGPISDTEEFLADESALSSGSVASLYLQIRKDGQPIDPGPWLEPRGMQMIRKVDAQ